MNPWNASMIEQELRRLGALQCLPLIQHITGNFAGFPFDHENSDPSFQLLSRLQHMHSPVEKSRTIHQAISTLDAFSWRAYVVTSVRDTPIYWNPLEMPWISFYPGRQKTILQTEWEFPPPDIIQHYCENIETALKHQ